MTRTRCWQVRSNEVASLAGTTVRALRHYHSVGILPEPPRDSNGYRHYRVSDLVQVLRIRRLASLGVPLESMPLALDPTEDYEALLTDLDAELERRIEELGQQRALLATIRAGGLAPELPPELAPFIRLLYEPGETNALHDLDRGLLLLMDQLSDGATTSQLATIFESMTDDDNLAVGRAINERFIELHGDDAPESVKAKLVDDIEAAVRPFVDKMEDSSVLDDDAAALFTSYQSELLSPDQQDVMERLASRLGT